MLRSGSCDVSFHFLQRYRINSGWWNHKFSCMATFRKGGKSVINRAVKPTEIKLETTSAWTTD